MCSEGKKKAIYAVSKELGIDVDWKGLDKLSDEEASNRIDELKAKQKESKAKPNSSNSEKSEPEINDCRLGMCFKLVYRSAEPGYWSEHKEEFKREVVNAYKLTEEAEKAVKSALSSTQQLKIERGA